MSDPVHSESPIPSPKPSRRIASLDWMRGIVMVLMVVDHASMAFNARHGAGDSAAFVTAGTVLEPGPFLTRWISHICAPTFVFLAGTALAISTERRLARGQPAVSIDRGILLRGAFIALLDPTLISLVSWRLTFQVLYAIGVSMMLMVLLRRLSTRWLLLLALGWIALGELVTGWVWDPSQGSSSPLAALVVAVFAKPGFKIIYPVIPWLSMMVLGWVFGRYLLRYQEGKVDIRPSPLLLLWGLLGLGVFVAVKAFNGYGNMFLLRDDGSWLQGLQVSKYPPSLAFCGLELGLLCLCLSALIVLEPRVGVRRNGPLLIFGQTAMFFYLLHRLVLEGSAQWLGLRGRWDLPAVYMVTAALLVVLYPLCRWYRGYKQAHPGGWRRYI